MNQQEIVEAWKTQKSQMGVSERFAERVMAGIRRREATRAEHAMSLLRSLGTRPWATAAAVIVGTLLGLVRIVVTLHLILFA